MHGVLADFSAIYPQRNVQHAVRSLGDDDTHCLRVVISHLYYHYLHVFSRTSRITTLDLSSGFVAFGISTSCDTAPCSSAHHTRRKKGEIVSRWRVHRTFCPAGSSLRAITAFSFIKSSVNRSSTECLYLNLCSFKRFLRFALISTIFFPECALLDTPASPSNSLPTTF